MMYTFFHFPKMVSSYKWFKLALILLLSSILGAQTNGNEQQRSVKIVELEQYNKWFSFTHINDLFSLFGTTDRYYSFGHQIDFMNQIKPKSLGTEKSKKYYNISLNFEGYTPEHELDFPDTLTTRPYAAWSYLGFNFISNKKNRYLKYSLDLGFVGPKARGKEIQNWVHKHISDDPEVIGWKDQIGNQIGINVGLDWRQTVYLMDKHRIMLGSDQKVGNVFSYLWPNIRYQFNGKNNEGYLPLQYVASSSSTFTLEASLGFRYEFYNLTIEGEPSNDVFQPLDESKINRAILTAGLGVRYHYRRFSICFSNQFNTNRVKDNDMHVYGTLGFSYSWQ